MRPNSLAASAGFDVLDESLAMDVRASLELALAAGAVFETGSSPLEVFRHAVSTAVRDIQLHPRGQLLHRFVVHGPYPHDGPFRAGLPGGYLSDEETAKAVRFVFSWVVNCFQGQLAELLATGPMVELTARFKKDGHVPRSGVIFFGDAVTARRKGRGGREKAADVHVLSEVEEPAGARAVRVHLVGEIKSYPQREPKVRAQLASHAERCKNGLMLCGHAIPPAAVHFEPSPPMLAWVRPGSWRLPRGFRFGEEQGRTLLHIQSPKPPPNPEEPSQLADGTWVLTLRWSYEALAAAAYGLSFWYMERIGEAAFASTAANPWPEMSPGEAGCNAAKQALYYAILRARTAHEHDRAVALYNAYGFGFALGMNFRGPDGQRRMLWPEDLREIRRDGVSRDGGRIAP